MKVSVVVASYNERENILRLIPQVREALSKNGYEYEIWVVDDDSPDKTAQAVKGEFGKDKRIRISVRKNTRGLGTALKLGIEKSSGEIVASMDADYLGDMSVLSKMLRLLEKKKGRMIVASRYCDGGGMESSFRNASGWVFNLFLRLLGFPIWDNTSGFYVIRKEDLLRLGLDKIYYGYGDYFFRLTYSAFKRGYKMVETPVFYPNRSYGESKTRLFPMVFGYVFEAIRIRFTSHV